MKSSHRLLWIALAVSVVGGTDMPNLWLATGHGTLGWTMAAGTAKVMAALIGGRPAPIDMEGLTLARYA